MKLRGIYEQGHVRLLESDLRLSEGQEVDLILSPVNSKSEKTTQNDAITELLEHPLKVESFELLGREQCHERHLLS